MAPDHSPNRQRAGSLLAARILSANGSHEHGSRERARCSGTELSADGVLLLEAAGYEPVGLVAGAAVFHIGLVGARLGNVELAPLSQALLGAREQATARMRSQAASLGAAGVVGVRIEIEAFHDKAHLARVVAIGTAVSPRTASDQGRQDAPFVAALSGQEFNVLVAQGYVPVSVVMGVCVYHVARLGPMAILRNLRATAELRACTEALYEARELAMRRLQDEALGGGAEGVVGVTLSESSHVWGNKTIELFCMGTAIRSVRRDRVRDARAAGAAAAPPAPLAPAMVLSVRDAEAPADPAALRGTADRLAPRFGR
jgi:uncharacterized protein YbjQ (UPF0145 family)